MGICCNVSCDAEKCAHPAGGRHAMTWNFDSEGETFGDAIEFIEAHRWTRMGDGSWRCPFCSGTATEEDKKDAMAAAMQVALNSAVKGHL